MEVPNKDVTCATMLWSHKHCKKIAIIWDRTPTPWKNREITNSLQPVWIRPQPCLQTALAPNVAKRWQIFDTLCHYDVPFVQISKVRARQVADKTRVRHISRPHNFPNLQSRVQSDVDRCWDGFSVEGPILPWESVWYCLEPSLLKKDLCTQAITAHTEGQLGIANCRKGVFMTSAFQDFPSLSDTSNILAWSKCCSSGERPPCMQITFLQGEPSVISFIKLGTSWSWRKPSSANPLGVLILESTLKWVEAPVLRRALIYQCADGQAVKHLGNSPCGSDSACSHMMARADHQAWNCILLKIVKMCHCQKPQTIVPQFNSVLYCWEAWVEVNQGCK